ncbi:MAG: hypothetical protein IT536_02265 [Hyphomicrobiales bacterium]|nr:hypothetical protein [Hyphomicrobiales bacterium]
MVVAPVAVAVVMVMAVEMTVVVMMVAVVTMPTVAGTGRGITCARERSDGEHDGGGSSSEERTLHGASPVSTRGDHRPGNTR